MGSGVHFFVRTYDVDPIIMSHHVVFCFCLGCGYFWGQFQHALAGAVTSEGLRCPKAKLSSGQREQTLSYLLVTNGFVIAQIRGFGSFQQGSEWATRQ